MKMEMATSKQEGCDSIIMSLLFLFLLDIFYHVYTTSGVLLAWLEHRLLGNWQNITWHLAMTRPLPLVGDMSGSHTTWVFINSWLFMYYNQISQLDIPSFVNLRVLDYSESSCSCVWCYTSIYIRLFTEKLITFHFSQLNNYLVSQLISKKKTGSKKRLCWAAIVFNSFVWAKYNITRGVGEPTFLLQTFRVQCMSDSKSGRHGKSLRPFIWFLRMFAILAAWRHDHFSSNFFN